MSVLYVKIMTEEKLQLEKLEKWINYLIKIGSERKLDEQEISTKIELMKEDMILNGELDGRYITEELISRKRSDPFFYLTGGAERFKKIGCPSAIRRAGLLDGSNHYYVNAQDSQNEIEQSSKSIKTLDEVKRLLEYDPNTYYEMAEKKENSSCSSSPSDKDLMMLAIDQKSIYRSYNDFTGNSRSETIEFHPKEFEKILEKQVGEELVFASKYVFNTTDLGRIIKVHLPDGANAYSDECKNNVLRVRFYQIPI